MPLPSTPVDILDVVEKFKKDNLDFVAEVPDPEHFYRLVGTKAQSTFHFLVTTQMNPRATGLFRKINYAPYHESNFEPCNRWVLPNTLLDNLNNWLNLIKRHRSHFPGEDPPTSHPPQEEITLAPEVQPTPAFVPTFQSLMLWAEAEKRFDADEKAWLYARKNKFYEFLAGATPSQQLMQNFLDTQLPIKYYPWYKSAWLKIKSHVIESIVTVVITLITAFLIYKLGW